MESNGQEEMKNNSFFQSDIWVMRQNLKRLEPEKPLSRWIEGFQEDLLYGNQIA